MNWSTEIEGLDPAAAAARLDELAGGDVFDFQTRQLMRSVARVLRAPAPATPPTAPPAPAPAARDPNRVVLHLPRGAARGGVRRRLFRRGKVFELVGIDGNLADYRREK